MEDNVRVVNKAFDILELLSKSESPMSLSEIVRETGISKSTVYRLLQTLYTRHYIEKDSNNNYQLGFKIVELVSNHINGLELQTEAKPIMASLGEKVPLTVHLGILEEEKVIYLEKFEQQPSTRVYSEVGRRSPAQCSSMGKCILANLKEEQIDYIVGKLEFQQYTQNTILDEQQFRKYLRKVKKQGWAMDDQEYMIGHRCIAAPVFNYKGETIASLSVSGSDYQLSDESINCVIEKVVEAAHELSKRLGYVG